METDKVGFALCGIVKAEFCKVAVCGVNIVKNKVISRSCNNFAFGDFAGKEYGLCAHEVFDVLHTKCGLHGKFCSAKISVCVKSVYKNNNAGCVKMHFFKFVGNIADCHGNSHLEGVFVGCEGAGLEECIKLIHDFALKFAKECVIGFLNRNSCAVLVNSFDRNCFCVFFYNKVFKCNRLYLCFGIRDNRTFGNCAVFKGNGCFVCFKNGAGCFANRVHDTEDIAKSIPVLAKAGNKINLSCGYVKVGSKGSICSGSDHGCNSICHELFILSGIK